MLKPDPVRSASVTSLPLISLRKKTRADINIGTPREAWTTTSRVLLEQVLDKCVSLRHDIGTSYRDLRSGFISNLSSIQKVKNQLNAPMHTRWKSSATYQEVKARIRSKEQEAKDIDLGSQVSSLLTFASANKDSANRDVKLTLRKTKLTVGKKAREVEEPVHIASQMLSAFFLAHVMARDPRGFGKAMTGKRIGEKLRRASIADDMEGYWKTEINKYDKQRNDRILGAEVVIKPSHAQESVPGVQKESRFESHLSPLQLYVHNYNTKKLLGEDATDRRHLKLEEKMQSIQPSPDVLALSQKYLPKHFKLRKKMSLHKPKSLSSIPKLTILKETAEDAPEEDFIKSEIKKELLDTEKLLNIETIVNNRNRSEMIKRAK